MNHSFLHKVKEGFESGVLDAMANPDRPEQQSHHAVWTPEKKHHQTETE